MTPPPVRNAALIGLGAIGTLYAAQISARDPARLRVIADAARIARYRADPPSFNGARLDLNYVTPDHPGPPADLVLVAVKSTGLAAALPAILARRSNQCREKAVAQQCLPLPAHSGG